MDFRSNKNSGKKEFDIEVKEELARVVTVKAETLGEAIDKVMEQYYGEKIVLSGPDVKGVDFLPYEDKEAAR